MSRTHLTLRILVSLACAPALAQAQTTWHVDDDCVAPGAGSRRDPFCTIQQGIDAARDADTVIVGSGTYTGDGNRDISLFGKTITLRSADGPSVTVMDIEGSPSSIHRGFFLIHGETLETVIEGFTIVNGYLIGDTGGPGSGGGGGGAAIFIRESSPVIRNCIMLDNVSMALSPPFPFDGLGAGVYVAGNSTAIIENCVIVNNFAERLGGGIMYIGDDNSNLTVHNCLIGGNSASNGGGLRTSGGGSSSITNTTIVYNAALFSGGGIHNSQRQALLSNCILWGNETESSGPQIFVQGPVLSIEYSDVQGGLANVEGCCNWQINWGPGMMDADPLFFDPDGGDYHVLHGSPVIDAGNNTAVPEGVTTDLDGGPRFLDDPDTPDTGNPDPDDPKLPIVDMGPYEFDFLDCNNNDVLDEQDIANGTSQDCNANTIPDDCEPDCNDNDQADSCDIAEGISDDCNDNGMPDECEVDCNENDQPDSCDIADGVSDDCNSNAVPDECEPDEDCNTNGIQDICDIADRTSADCNANGTPDECEEEPDCNGNGQFDSCDIAEGSSVDCHGGNGVPDGVPDECCPGDVGPGENNVGPFDLAALLASWGPCPDSCIEGVPACQCPADFDRNCTVNAHDLAFLLGHWGPCPP